MLRAGDKLFSLTQFEEAAGMMYLTELAQDRASGALRALATRPVDLGPAHGGWLFCAGMPTPWGSHLGGEEYPVDARGFEHAHGRHPAFDRHLELFGLQPDDADRTRPAALARTSVYRIGYPVEVTLTGEQLGTGPFAANARATKHYAMGRLSWEVASVLPDRRTVYAGDDGIDRGLFRFVADAPGDLSAGHLFAARLTQVSAADGGRFAIDWISLGHASSGQVDRLISQGVAFSDLFAATGPVGDRCPNGFAPVQADGRQECLALRRSNRLGMAAAEIVIAASRLEPLRLAALRGASTEWHKLEGLAFDAVRQRLYLAVSVLGGAMSAAPALVGLRNAIHLPANPCGAVYALPVDADGVATSMQALLAGLPRRDGQRPPRQADRCDIDRIAGPDNLAMGPTDDLLIIAEDTNGHQNNVMWAYDLQAGTLTRILSSPYGAETTSPFYYRDLNGFGYLTAVVQHPYGESDHDKARGQDDRRAVVGVIGPFPVIER
ncbi:MAG: DUF839 domain-containing protein [Burkholderiaceae bacterium]